MNTAPTERTAIDAVVLFTGRGGSGTRLLSQLAADAGIFIGNHVNKSGDSIEWIDLVYRMVLQTVSQHDLPSGSKFRQAIRERAQHILNDRPLSRSGLWGLKLPETMLVLPLLIDAFPHAKVVHLTRHPVSSSLRRTHMTSNLDTAVGAVALPAAYRYANRDAGQIATDAPYLHNAYAWNFQVSRIVHYARAVLGATRYLEIRYEDICAQPDGILALIQSYLGCAGERVTTSLQVDNSRVGGWDPRDPRVETIWKICGDTAALLGYTRDLAASSRTRADHQAL
jgi:hypothetical protein